jgi:hypothetical protein
MGVHCKAGAKCLGCPGQVERAIKVRDHLCYSGSGLEVHVDGQRTE